MNPATGAGLPDNPNAASLRRQRSADRRVRIAQSVQLRRAPRDRRGLDRRRGLEHVGGDRAPPGPDRDGDELRLAVLRGLRPAERLRLGEPLDLREPLRRRHRRGPSAAVRLEPRRPGRARRRAARPAARRRPASRSRRPMAATRPSTAGRSSSPTTRATASGRCCRAQTACPTRRRIRTFAAGAANPCTSRSGPAATCSTPTSTAAPSARSASLRPTSRRRRSPRRRPRPATAPLTVQFDGSGSSDPDAGDTLTYAWDLDGDGQYDDSTAATPSLHLHEPGQLSPRACASPTTTPRRATAAVTITVGNTAPTATIISPAPGTTWQVGDLIQFAGGATDAQDGPLPASALSWSLILHHCPSNCHTHTLQSFDGVAGGSFTTPDHEYPSHLELRLTVTDSGGLTDTRTVRLDPRTVTLTLNSSPIGFALVINGSQADGARSRGPSSRDRRNTISAPSPQTKAKKTWQFGMVRRRRADPRRNRQRFDDLHRHLQTALSPAAAFENDVPDRRDQQRSRTQAPGARGERHARLDCAACRRSEHSRRLAQRAAR